MNRTELIQQIRTKKSFLCVGLDPDLDKIPRHLLELEDPIFEFNKAIIEATQEFCVAYKPNSAFYEAHGIKGWQSLLKTIAYLNEKYPQHFTIADAKRGDIGNTSRMYAKAFLEEMNVDAITVAPYMGCDSVKPFLEVQGKWAIVLALTSNEGAFDFQTHQLQFHHHSLYEQVIHISKQWGNTGNLMYVVGATKAEMLATIRKIIPQHFLLIPGIGAQGGSLKEVCKYGLTSECGLLVNSSRGILYAGKDMDFMDKASEEARNIQQEMEELLW